MKRFEGKSGLLTGAASGIGAATARRLADEGARLVLCDIDGEAGERVAKETGSEFVQVDVSNASEVEAAVSVCVERFGRIDVLFNNAGRGLFGRTPDVPIEDWHDLIAVNLHSIYYGCRAAIPHMCASGGGAIVNTGSNSGLAGDYGLGAYNATKGAVVNYTRSLALDHARDGIRVNAVCPGPVDTGLTRDILSRPALVEDFERRIPLGRFGRADELAAVVAFLASDDASFVTGATLVADGGLSAHTGHPNFLEFAELGDDQ